MSYLHFSPIYLDYNLFGKLSEYSINLPMPLIYIQCTEAGLLNICILSHIQWLLYFIPYSFVIGTTAPPPSPAGNGLLIHEVSRSHTTTNHSR